MMNDIEGQQKIKAHYHRENLMERIKSELTRQGRSLSSLVWKDLAAFDELHVGGRNANRMLAEKAHLITPARVLDVGSGIGGPARMLAHDFGWEVVGVDLTESFCQVASRLSEAVGIRGAISFVAGNALDLPFKSQSFDAVWNQHCSMNIQNKQALYAEFGRMLKPRGRLLIHDIMSGAHHPVFYPVPWATTDEFSFLISAEEQQEIIFAAGFREVHREDITGRSLAWYDTLKQSSSGQEPPILTQKLVFGDALRQMANHMKQNMKEGRIRVIEAIWEKES